MIPTRLRALAAGAACLAALAPTGAAQWTAETVPTPRTAVAITATSNGKVLIAGGATATASFVPDLDIFDEATGTWTSTTLPKPMRFHSAASVGTSAFFGDGLMDTTSGPTGEVYEYDTLTGTITTHLTFSAGWNGAMASVGSYLVVINGLDPGGAAVTEVNVFDTVTKVWSVLNLPLAVQKPAVTAVGDIVLVVGGKDTATQPMDAVQWINPSMGTTGSFAPLPQAATAVAAGTLGPKAWFLGGLTNTGETKQLVTFDDRFDSQVTSTLPIPLHGATAVPVGNRLVVGGGTVNDSPSSAAVLLEADGSVSQTNFPVSLFNAVGAGTDRKAYFAGGFDGVTFAPLSQMFVYTNPDVLTLDTVDLSLSAGGKANFDFLAGPADAGKSFVLMFSISGTSPGFFFDGQLIPLNIDSQLIKSIVTPGLPPLYNAAGILGPDGHVQPYYEIPPGLNPSLAGLTLSFAAASYDLTSVPIVSTVSNPQAFTFIP